MTQTDVRGPEDPVGESYLSRNRFAVLALIIVGLVPLILVAWLIRPTGGSSVAGSKAGNCDRLSAEQVEAWGHHLSDAAKADLTQGCFTPNISSMLSTASGFSLGIRAITTHEVDVFTVNDQGVSAKSDQTAQFTAWLRGLPANQRPTSVVGPSGYTSADGNTPTDYLRIVLR